MGKGKVFYGWWIVAGAAIILAVMGSASVAVANLYQAPVTAEFGISNSQFAISHSLVLGVGIFLSPFISQKFATGNFNRIYAISVLVYALAYIGYAFTSNIYVFYLLSLLVGYGYMSTTFIPTTMLINKWFVKKRGLALSLALTGLGIGGVVFSQLVTTLIENVGWRMTYVVYGLIMLAVVLPIVLFVYKVNPEDMQLKAYGTAADDLGQARERNEDDEGEMQQVQAVRMSVSESMKKPFFVLLVAGSVLVGITNNGGLGQFPPVLTELHGATVAAMIISVYSAVGIVGKLILGNLNDRFGIIVSILYSCILLALSYVLMMFAGNLAEAFVSAVLFGLGNAIGTVLPPLMTSSVYSAEQYPKVYGYVQSGVQLGMTVRSLFAAGIADLTGSYNVSWIAIAALSVVVAFAWGGSYRNARAYIA